VKTDSRVAFWIFLALLLVAATIQPAAARPAEERPPGITAFWWAVGVCETGHIGAAGDGAPRWDWGKHRRPLEGSAYEGFTGFRPSTWQWWAGALKLLDRYPHAYDAPPIVQQRVAHYGLTNYGAWGCIISHAEIRSLPGR
jgi:hypothetical protein